ncbi:MAG TPA: homoserine dehydrogenase [Dehalococcoidia bacterium]|nr:homoserine dehydrogenase [Dehalococcoidia bacterium]
MNTKEIGIGLLGVGTVGGGVARVLLEKGGVLAGQTGCRLVLRKALVRDLGRARSVSLSPDLLTLKPEEVIERPDVDVVVELMGGEGLALKCMESALAHGKHLVTANKEVMAKHGPSLLALAQKNGVEVRYEGSVGGGIPLIAPFQRDLVANEISAIHSILNGTTNYILTRMADDGMDFSVALQQAQDRGYAEADPTYDIEGIDAKFKLSILASLAFRSWVNPKDVFSEGISRLEAKDFRYAREFGYAIKLLAIAKKSGDFVEARVHPVLIADDSLLAQVRGVFNAVQVEGDLVGRIILFGRGAGAQPTASAVMADIVAVSRNIMYRIKPAGLLPMVGKLKMKPMSEVESRYYLRLNVFDQPGVLAQIATVLGSNRISISQVIQKETDEASQSAEIVIMTHVAREEAMQRALVGLGSLEVVRKINNFVRVEM